MPGSPGGITSRAEPSPHYVIFQGHTFHPVGDQVIGGRRVCVGSVSHTTARMRWEDYAELKDMPGDTEVTIVRFKFHEDEYAL